MIRGSKRPSWFGALSCALAVILPLEPALAQVEGQAESQLKIVVLEGEGAVNYAKQRVARETIVQVQDENNRPVAGATVSFFLPQHGASGTFANGTKVLNVITDADGKAVIRGLRPNDVPGEVKIEVRASYQGKSGRTTISQTNAAAAAAGAAAASGLGMGLKVLAALAVVGAAVGSAYAVSQRAPATKTPTPTTIVPGTPTVR